MRGISVLNSAQSALLTVMVPAELLPDANGWLRTAQEALRPVGPLAGARLFVAVGGHVIAVLGFGETVVYAIAGPDSLSSAPRCPGCSSVSSASSRRTPAHLQGRAYSAAVTLVTIPLTLSIATGAALINLTGYRPMLTVMAAGAVLAAAYLLTRPENRHRPDRTPAQVRADTQR
jgi:hypothetical protein